MYKDFSKFLSSDKAALTQLCDIAAEALDLKSISLNGTSIDVVTRQNTRTQLSVLGCTEVYDPVSNENTQVFYIFSETGEYYLLINSAIALSHMIAATLASNND